MRTTVVGAFILAGLVAALPVSVQAQSSQDLLQSLQLPKGSSGTSRGIRAAPATGDTGTAPSGAPSAGHSAAAGTRSHHAAANAAGAEPASGEANIYVQFKTGSAELSPAAVHVLNSLGTAVTSPQLAGDRFRIEGHTDTVGSPETNKALSEQRASAVIDYLVNNFHIDRNRFDAVGLGETDLLVQTPPQTPEARNRRVRVVNLGA